MMFTSLDASSYSHSGSFYNAEFESVLSKIVMCYNLMLADKVMVANDENLLRDAILLKYLKNNEARKKVDLLNYLFDREVPEDTTRGRTDIKIQTLNTFTDVNAYYTIECKRLNATNTGGTTGLNAEYIQNGINRFVSKSYASHYKTNGMIGFVVQPMDVNENVKAINKLLKDSFKGSNTTRELSSLNIADDFNYCYYSAHTNPDGELLIYHLMLDVSGNIQA